MKHKLSIIFLLFFLVHACSGVGGKRSNKSDEFLIEKKNPLVMPPDIDDLPTPKESLEVDENKNDFEEKIKSKKIDTKDINNEEQTSLEKSIIKKIEQ